MLIVKLVLFIGLFLGITYGVEYILPPFGALFYTNPLEILISLSKSLAYWIGIPDKYSLGLTVLIIGIVPLVIVIKLGKILKKKRKNIKYRFK